jgi:hypothetical protein
MPVSCVKVQSRNYEGICSETNRGTLKGHKEKPCPSGVLVGLEEWKPKSHNGLQTGRITDVAPCSQALGQERGSSCGKAPAWCGTAGTHA